MMAEVAWPKVWQRYKKHRKATRRDWDSGKALKWSEDNEGASQYHPYLFGTDEAVRQIEFQCVENGTEIHASPNKRTYYLETEQIVGACCGELTRYVFAEWHRSGGAIHGRPISITALRKLGVNDEQDNS
ncbi:MAG TPA: hypothetical protein VND64_13090 [Pirellulales bacterium]|nr:hypothetical protein [Pirellulales bacterium]